MALAVIKGISCWIIYFFALESDQGGIIPAKQCWLLNALLTWCTIILLRRATKFNPLPSWALCSTKRERITPFPCLGSTSKAPHQLPKAASSPKGQTPKVRGFHPQFLSSNENEVWSAGPTPWRQLQVKLAIFPAFDMPRHLFSPKAKHTQKRTELQRFTPAHYFSVALNPTLRSQSDLLTVEISELMAVCSVGWICRGSFNILLSSKGSCDPENQRHWNVTTLGRK